MNCVTLKNQVIDCALNRQRLFGFEVAQSQSKSCATQALVPSAWKKTPLLQLPKF
jgi:hypothetical protein